MAVHSYNTESCLCGKEISPSDSFDAADLLCWMGQASVPLELFREEDSQLWMVIDASEGHILAAAETPLLALFDAHAQTVAEVRG